MPGQFLLKDAVLLGAAIWSLFEALSSQVNPRTSTTDTHYEHKGNQKNTRKAILRNKNSTDQNKI
jgi:hypothetical protein